MGSETFTVSNVVHEITVVTFLPDSVIAVWYILVN